MDNNRPVSRDAVVQKFLALDMWAHRALDLVKLGVRGEKTEETLKMVQKCLHQCREVIENG